MDNKKTECVKIITEDDIGVVRKFTREFAVSAGFNILDQTKLVTASSEIARNSFQYAVNGSARFEILQSDKKTGVSVVFTDEGPGIEDVTLAMKDGFSSLKDKGSLGLGLPGAKRLVNEFYIESVFGKGTTVKIIKWK